MTKRMKIIGAGAATVIVLLITFLVTSKLIAPSAGERGDKTTILYDVPFTAQAPLAEWSDLRQQDGCEEASVLMAVSWAKGIDSIDPKEARAEIIAASDWELEKYGNYRDTSIDDTAQRIIKEFLGYSKVAVKRNISVGDIIEALEDGKLVIVPANGYLLKNPYFSSPPERHMLVVIGYDYKKKEFITNDPGSRYGKNFRYGKDQLFEAIRDYPSDTGTAQAPIIGNEKNIIIVSK